jgi:hypothetical protein
MCPISLIIVILRGSYDPISRNIKFILMDKLNLHATVKMTFDHSKEHNFAIGTVITNSW